MKLPLEGNDLIKELLRRQRLPDNPDKAIKECARLFEEVYNYIPLIGKKATKKYKEIQKRDGKDCGAVVLYFVGGRVSGKPLNLKSDFDFIFTVENKRDGIFWQGYFDMDVNKRSAKMKELKEFIIEQIPLWKPNLREFFRDRLQILDYGSKCFLDEAFNKPSEGERAKPNLTITFESISIGLSE